MTRTRRFPDGVRWGSATAAHHEIEGGNTNNDRWAWAHTDGTGVAEPSGDACDSWHRWADDIDVVGSPGLDHYRFVATMGYALGMPGRGRPEDLRPATDTQGFVVFVGGAG